MTMVPRGPATGSGGLPVWLPATVVGFVPLAILRIKLGPVGDPDAFWHIRGGDHVWSTHTVAGPDPFSAFTAKTWVQHEWLGEVVMSRVNAAFGLPAVAWLAAVADVLAYLTVYRLCRQRGGVLVSGTVAAVAWLGMSASLTPRPQVVSFILLAVTARAWLRTVDDRRARWWLVPVTWLWACTHGLWAIGPLVGLVVLLGMVLDRRVTWKEAGRLALVPALSILAAALTPVGPRLLLVPFTINGYAPFISEFASPDIRQWFVAATMVLLVGTAFGWTRRGSVEWSSVLLWVIAFGCALLYARTVAIGAILVAPLAAAELQRLLRRDPDEPNRAESLILAIGVSAAVVLAGVVAPHVASSPAVMPTALSPLLSELPPATVVLDDDSVGGWLIYAHPDLRPVVDTRLEIYSKSFLTDYINAKATGLGWSDFVSTTGAHAALLKRGTPLVEALQTELGWRVVQTDRGYVLLVVP
jgi:hypothetical protein